MDIQRSLYKQSLVNDLKMKINIIDHTKRTLTRIKSSDFNNEFIDKQIIMLKKRIEDTNELVEKIKINIEQVSSGLLDPIIIEKWNLSKKYQDGIIEFNNKRKTEKKLDNEHTKTLYNGMMKMIKTENKEIKQTNRDIKYGYKCFLKAIDTVPDYMIKNLQKMPNNRGYIWRGCHFYGELPSEDSAPLVMFNKVNGVVQIIETYPTEIRIYEKPEKYERKILISKQKRYPVRDRLIYSN